MDLVVAHAVGTTPLPVSGDAVAHLPESGQRLDVNVDQVARPLPLVPLHRWFWLKIAQASEPQTAESPGDGGEGSLQRPGELAQMQPLVTGDPRRAALAADRAFAAGGSARCVDPPERLHHLINTAPASGWPNGG